MRKLIAWAFMYSLDGLLPHQDSDYWTYCFGLPVDPAEQEQKIELFESADIHVMGRTTYQAMHDAMTTTDHPFAGFLNAGRKVVFSRSLTADWANTTIAAGDTAEEIELLTQNGEGHIVVWGGVGLWRSLLTLDLIDEFRFDLHPYVAGEGTRLFDGVPTSYRLDLVASTQFSNGIVGLQYQRPR